MPAPVAGGSRHGPRGFFVQRVAAEPLRRCDSPTPALASSPPTPRAASGYSASPSWRAEPSCCRFRCSRASGPRSGLGADRGVRHRALASRRWTVDDPPAPRHAGRAAIARAAPERIACAGPVSVLARSPASGWPTCATWGVAEEKDSDGDPVFEVRMRRCPTGRELHLQGHPDHGETAAREQAAAIRRFVGLPRTSPADVARAGCQPRPARLGRAGRPRAAPRPGPPGRPSPFPHRTAARRRSSCRSSRRTRPWPRA